MSGLTLHLDQLAAERSGRAVFSGLALRAEAGGLVRVSGANGAGKTTLLRILAGLGAPHAGRAEWRRDGAALTPAEAALFVGHSNACNDLLSVEDNLAYAGALLNLPSSGGDIRRALTALGVAPLRRQRFGSLSQGQKKRVSLARLLLPQQQGRRAWLLDEPFVALDAATQALLAQLIEAELAAGGLVLLTSHQTVEIRAARAQELRL